MPGGSNRKQRIIEAFDALCGAIARALGAAEGRRDAAVRAHAEAMVEMWLREDGLESARADPGLGPLLANKKLFGPVGRVEADRHAAFTPWLEHGPDELTGLLADGGSRGAAGRPPENWLGTGRQDRGRRTGARSVVPRPGSDREPAGGRVPGRGAAARRVAPAGGVHAEGPGGGRGAGAEPVAAGDELLPARAGAAARLGHRQRRRHAARPLPADPQRPAHRARPEAAAAAAGGAVGPDPPDPHPGAGRRAPLAARDGPRRRRASAPSRGWSRC